jgi:hypothetical protein
MSMLERAVMNIWAGSARFGTVIEEKTENNWRYIKVRWTNDEAFEQDRTRVLKLRNLDLDEEKDWYRIDKVRIIDPAKMITTLSRL